MRRHGFSLPLLLLTAASLAAAPSVKVAPVALNFTYQEGAATLPAPLTLAVTAVTGAPASNVFVSSTGSQWLVFSPTSGRTALSVRVSVNPTTLPVGQYNDTLTFSTPETGGDPVSVPVRLTVKAPPAEMQLSATVLTITHRLGDPPPAPSTVNLTATGGLLSFSASAGSTKWLRVTPASGAIFPGFRTALTINTDLTDLAPGPQKGTIAISAPDAVNKTATITVNLTVQPGIPVASTIWPPRILRGAPDSTVTITGLRFFAGTTVASGSTTLKTSILGPNALTAVIPASLLATAGNVPIVVSNPDPGGGAATAINLEVLPPGPIPLAIVNAASQLPGSLSPGMVFTIYGSGLGPEELAAFDGTTPAVPTTMGGTRVLLDGNPLPVIYSSARQVSAAAPNNLEADRAYLLRVEYDTVQSSALAVASVATAPALFTASGAGTGNAAAFQADATTGAISINSEKTPATRGSILILYATGLGPVPPIPVDGTVATEASPTSLAGVSVLLGESAAEVLYAGAAPGLITGILQINARIPTDAPTGKAVPLTIRSGSIASQANVTVNIK